MTKKTTLIVLAALFIVGWWLYQMGGLDFLGINL